jgi:hypothetical protein
VCFHTLIGKNSWKKPIYKGHVLKKCDEIVSITLFLSTVVIAALALITVLGYLSILLVEGPVLSILNFPVVEVLTVIHL